MAIDNLLDDADLDIVDDEMDMERKNRTDGSSCCSISYECEEWWYKWHFKTATVSTSLKEKSEMTKFTPFFREVISLVEVQNI